ncbi:glycine N-acyltransferase-like [Pleurodeles waltl]|uniref:glycine N-acyltransferase-like n=1 Tax=Pleurodeles waltl TaxID=8319 RepID=UPI0037099833
MLVLESSEDRKKLEELLAQSVPESMKVYGSIFYINRGNPLNMEVLVDSWPDFKTVICKKRPAEMIDDTNFYINTYNVFTKDPENFREMLWSADVINWNQCLLIQVTAMSYDINMMVDTHSMQTMISGAVRLSDSV